jgi:hypothetical protein
MQVQTAAAKRRLILHGELAQEQNCDLREIPSAIQGFIPAREQGMKI